MHSTRRVSLAILVMSLSCFSLLTARIGFRQVGLLDFGKDDNNDPTNRAPLRGRKYAEVYPHVNVNNGTSKNDSTEVMRVERTQHRVEYGGTSTTLSTLLNNTSTERQNNTLSSFRHYNSTTSKTSSNSEDAIFFNIYIDPNSDTTKRAFALFIVQEQLNQISQGSNDRIVYYNLIGYMLPHLKDRFCVPGLTCKRLQHVRSGYENVTLQSLYEYCESHPTARVTYLHNKGSLSNHAMNMFKRQRSTRVVISDECRYMPKDQCNVCTTTFRIDPHWHAPGNFWTADCDYVSKLIPPKYYEAKRIEMFDEMYDPSNSERFKCLVPSLNENYTGTNQRLSLGRFNWEYWIWNHPDLKPCDAFPSKDVALESIILSDSEWQPTLTVPSRAIESPPSKKLHAWFQKTGKLYEFRKLYGRDPPQESLLWKTLLPHENPLNDCRPAYELDDKTSSVAENNATTHFRWKRDEEVIDWQRRIKRP